MSNIPRKTKYGEPTRRFGKLRKKFAMKNDWAYKRDAEKQKKSLRKKGYLARITKKKGGYRVWFRQTPKSRKYEKGIFKR